MNWTTPGDGIRTASEILTSQSSLRSTEIYTNRKLNVGDATFSSDGNINSLWVVGLNDWINNTITNRFVQDVRLGGIEYAQAWNRPGYNDTPGYVITGVTNDNSDELIDGVHRRPLQKLIGGIWYNIASI